jgi:hypothetical protein
MEEVHDELHQAIQVTPMGGLNSRKPSMKRLTGGCKMAEEPSRTVVFAFTRKRWAQLTMSFLDKQFPMTQNHSRTLAKFPPLTRDQPRQIHAL